MCACVRTYVRACARARVCACVRVCVHACVRACLSLDDDDDDDDDDDTIPLCVVASRHRMRAERRVFHGDF